MTVKRLIAIFLIFLLGVFGWFVLGQANWMRSHETTSNLSTSVQNLWGGPIVQRAPSLTIKVPGTDRTRRISPTSNQIKAQIVLEQRKKGLLWYPTYSVYFTGLYQVTNEAKISQDIRLNFPLPSKNATYQDVRLKIGDRVEKFNPSTGYGFQRIIPLRPGSSEIIEVQYKTRGIGSWQYQLDGERGQVSNLEILVSTNFTDVDFVDGGLSPMHTTNTDTGLEISWQAMELITRQNVGISMPQKLNPGPLAARMSFFAPICLLFFFVLISAICVKRKIDIHPMHYLFVNAGFFAFHLLFAYSIDLINVHLAFVIAATVSVLLVIVYLSRALGRSFPWGLAAIGQLVYLVLFSYSFFLDGVTGLTVTIASILTLAVIMKLTSETNWNEVFVKKQIVASPEAA